MKRKSQRTCQSYSLSPRSARQISESFNTNGHKNKRNSVHYLNLKQVKEKLETELLFLKDVNIRDWNVLFSLRNDISNRYSKNFVHKTKQKRIEQIVFPYGNNIYKQSRLNLKGWEWRWFLRKVRDLKLLYKNMKYLKIVLFPSLSHGDRIPSC